MIAKAEELLVPIRRIHERIRDGVVEAFHRTDSEELSAIAKEAEGDTLYAVDRVGEELLVELFDREIARKTSVVLVAEGLDEGGQVVLPAGTSENDAVWRIIVDPNRRHARRYVPEEKRLDPDRCGSQQRSNGPT